MIMIPLSRLNGKEFVLNTDLIQSIEATPDTLIVLTNGEKLMVRQSVKEVMDAALDYRRRIFQHEVSANGS